MSALTAAETRRWVRVEHIMGTAVSVHVVLATPGGGRRADTTEAASARAANAAFADLRGIERIFSPYLPESDVSRIRDGRLDIEAADPLVAEVARLCDSAERLTGGRFSAYWRGGFDPTGYVKGWAVESAFDVYLRPLLELDGVTAVGMNAGGDLQVDTAADADWEWEVGIAHPRDRDRLGARLALRAGAVATSGPAERGEHIMDPVTGRPAVGVLSASVVSPHLADADVWATAAVVAGIEELDWVATAPMTSGVMFGDDGRVRRWSGGVEVASAQPLLNMVR